MAVRVVDDAWVEEYVAEAAARSRRAMERSTREAGFVAKALFCLFVFEDTFSCRSCLLFLIEKPRKNN